MKADLEKGTDSVTEKTSLLGNVNLLESVDLMKGGTNSMLALVTDDACITDYDPETLTNWAALVNFKGSIFAQKSMWMIIILQLSTAWGIAGLIYFFATRPDDYSSDSMSSVVKTLTVSIAFLLGMFLSACLGRWWDTVKSIESLFGSSKKLLMTAINLQLSEEFCNSCSHLCVLSVLMVETEMTIRKQKGPEQQNWIDRFDDLQAKGQITADERTLLEKVPAMERSFFAWSVLSQRLTDIRRDLVNKDGTEDTVAYDRICELVGVGVSSVSSLKTMMTFQIPFVYVHMLGFMVHTVNLLTAVSSGVSVGLMYSRSKLHGTHVDHNAVTTDMVFLVVQACIYQAFLSIGAALSFPVTGEAYHIPLNQMTNTLERQLKLMATLAFEHRSHATPVPSRESSSRAPGKAAK